MTKYEKIWIPISRVPKNWEDAAEAFVHKGNTIYMTARQNSIVLTIEELREIWDKGYVRGCEESEAKHVDQNLHITAPNFIEYITFKGIKNE